LNFLFGKKQACKNDDRQIALRAGAFISHNYPISGCQYRIQLLNCYEFEVSIRQEQGERFVSMGSRFTARPGVTWVLSRRRPDGEAALFLPELPESAFR
jgi:hypothetical protein